jgi:acetylornithine deacetylase/succinyl-diaminopimelate desuccinylase-like protein
LIAACSPEEKVQIVKAEIMGIIRAAQKRDKQLKVEIEYPLHVPPGWTKETEPICQIAKQAVKEVVRKTPRLRMAGGFTDMHFLTEDMGVPTVGYGAYGGGAHSDDEFLTTTSLLQTAKVYAAIIARLG